MAAMRIDQADARGRGAGAALILFVLNAIGADSGFGRSRLTTPQFDLQS
jgi:hypothetical protein